MNHNKLQTIILFQMITFGDSKHWYPASVVEKEERFVGNTYDSKQNDDQIYVQVLTRNNSDRVEETKWQNVIKPSINENKLTPFKQKDNISPYMNSTIKREIVKYNNNVHVLNVIRRHPNRKIIRKKCSSVKNRLRGEKQLFLNQEKRRFLEVFEVVEFEHVLCTSSSGLEGTCLHEYDCQTAGGTAMGSCADGYGTCCVNQFQCDDNSAAAIGWFTNPSFPSPSTDRLSCTITLNKASEDIKQIRLDFVTFELLPPTDGTCEDDQFIVSGQNINNVMPILCGINTGQHAYLEVGDMDGPLYLSVQTVSSENRLFSIKVTQLTSADELAAPNGCFQYFSESQGYMESFNYRDKSDIGIARYSSYLNNMNYAMCIKRASGTCSVTYSKSDKLQIVNYDADGLPVIPPGQAGVEIFNCPSDWLLISAIRLCGERLNDGSVLQDFSLDASVTDNSAGPIVVWFRSDGGYVGRGFKLYYQQNACNDQTV